jgi:hypothetical protein
VFSIFHCVKKKILSKTAFKFPPCNIESHWGTFRRRTTCTPFQTFLG